MAKTPPPAIPGLRMNYPFIIFVAIAGFIVGSIFYRSPLEKELSFNPLNATYVINNDSIKLTNGKGEKSIIFGSASKITVNVWGQPQAGDLNNDRQNDAALILTYESGGSGTFYYAAAALKNHAITDIVTTNAVLIGDRISPQNISISRGTVEINYTDRYPWESFAESPSLGKTKRLIVVGEEFKEIELPILSQETAENLAKQEWGDCSDAMCSELKVSVLDGKDGVWFVQAVYGGVKDDSVRAIRKIALAHYADEKWELGSLLVDDFRCQQDRGHQDFSDQLCL